MVGKVDTQSLLAKQTSQMVDVLKDSINQEQETAQKVVKMNTAMKLEGQQSQLKAGLVNLIA